MLHSLRARFLVSHVLPLLVTIPLIGVALTYLVETQVLLQNLSNEMKGQAVLLADLVGQEPRIWYDRVQAQAFLKQLGVVLDARIMLLDPDGTLLGSSEAADQRLLGQLFEVQDWAELRQGITVAHTSYSRSAQSEVVEVLVPVITEGGRLAGVLRLSRLLGGVSQRFTRLRTLIAGVLVAGLLVGAVVGWALAIGLERPLKRVTQAVQKLTGGEALSPVVEEGPREVRLLSRSFNSLVERLRNVEHTRRQLLSNLVHELGRPLGAVRSAVQALLGGADEEVDLRRELLTGIEGEVGNLQRLLEDLAGLHNQVLGTVNLELQPLSISGWLPTVLAPWRESAQAKNLLWKSDIPTDLPNLEADRDRLAQAVGNLLSNAIKFTPPGGQVSVSAGTETGSIWIRVGDTGPGIPPAEQERIFTPFFRSQTSPRFPEGMGLGLSIARDLVAAHGGQLDVQSTLGAGTQFTIWLPYSAKAWSGDP
jgi:two-component system, OmpR family, sensor histidine kinase BaeS